MWTVNRTWWIQHTAAWKRFLPPPTFIQVCQDPNEGAYNPKIKPPSCPLLLIPDITSNLTKCHLQNEMTSMESVKTVHLKAASCLAQVCSPLSETSKVPTHDTRGNSSCITPAPADLSWWRKSKGRGGWWDSHEQQSRKKPSVPAAGADGAYLTAADVQV